MTDLPQLLGHWGYVAIFVVVVLGNVGLPLPEETVLALAGYLVWRGALSLPPVLALGVGGAGAGGNPGPPLRPRPWTNAAPRALPPGPGPSRRGPSHAGNP